MTDAGMKVKREKSMKGDTGKKLENVRDASKNGW